MKRKVCAPVIGILTELGGVGLIIMSIFLGAELISSRRYDGLLSVIVLLFLGIVYLILGSGIYNCKKWAALSFFALTGINLIFTLVALMLKNQETISGFLLPLFIQILCAAAIYSYYRKGKFE